MIYIICTVYLRKIPMGEGKNSYSRSYPCKRKGSIYYVFLNLTKYLYSLNLTKK